MPIITTLYGYKGKTLRIEGVTRHGNDDKEDHDEDSVRFSIRDYDEQDTIITSITNGSGITVAADGTLSMVITDTVMDTLSRKKYHWRYEILNEIDSGDNVISAMGDFHVL